MRERDHHAIFAVKGNGMMSRTGVVNEVFAGATLAVGVAIATLQNENLFNADVLMRWITTAWLHPNQHCGIASLFIASQNIYEDSLVSRYSPIYCRKVEHRRKVESESPNQQGENRARQ
jgi:hypothetical protein